MIRCTRSLWEVAAFDPITATLASVGSALASAAPYVAAGASLLASGVSALGSRQAGNAQAQAATYNARLAEQQATTELQAGALASGRVYEERRRDIARARAAGAASGVDATSGSPLDVLADLAGQAKLEEETVFWNGYQRARAAGAQVPIEQYRAQVARSSGRGQALGTLLSAGPSAVGTFRNLRAAL